MHLVLILRLCREVGKIRQLLYCGSPPSPAIAFCASVGLQRQTFDLPQPILSLGGRAKILLLGMAQRQTLMEQAGETANHYYVCVSHAALQGTRLRSCRLADPAHNVLHRSVLSADISAMKIRGDEKEVAEESATGKPAEVAYRARGRGTRGMRLQWVVTVFVRKVIGPRPAEDAGEPNSAAKTQHVVGSLAQGMVVKKYDDTPCAELLEEYAHKRTQRVEDVRLTFTNDSGRVLPRDGVVGDFAVEGRLELIDGLGAGR